MAEFTFWGVCASPYQLKMQALVDFSGHSWQRWPDQAGRVQALGMAWRLRRARKRGAVRRLPAYVPGMDEYPAVPYYSQDRRRFYYDSSGLALALDQHPQRHQWPLIPEDPAQRFICRLIDEAFDEFGLYMVHHNRWVTSGTTTPMGTMTVQELRHLLPPGIGKRYARQLPERQVRRCPYLFSVAPEGFQLGVPESLTPPSREGFPATHVLLDTAWRRYLGAMEQLLAKQAFLLGERFTLADASVYGQLGMNLVDGIAADILASDAPRTFRWLCSIRDGVHSHSGGELEFSPRLGYLLAEIVDTFVPLMRQNAAAYREARNSGQALFNEAAFDRGEALYRGELMELPFRSVVKTFQVQVWRDVCDSWNALPPRSRQALCSRYPMLEDRMFRDV